jgi:hypothetical protein
LPNQNDYVSEIFNQTHRTLIIIANEM